MNITVVTVTYGRRAHLLIRALDAARAQGAAAAIVVDNGSADAVSELLAARYGGWARLEPLGSNRGSALGFKTGIAAAVAQGAGLILLLDDDNVPAPGCLSLLSQAWRQAVAAGARRELLAVHAARRGAGQTPAASVFQEPRADSFLGFHVAEVPGKLLRRVAPRLFARFIRSGAADEISVAPYGGMLFHADLIAVVGLPDEAFFLYVDDYEFSSRITGQGGSIRLIRDALIEDIDSSWGVVASQARSAIFTGRLEMKNTSKIYYAVRNMVHFQSSRTAGGGMYRLNRLGFRLILAMMAVPGRRRLQYRTILRAIQDGEQHRRGYNPAYVL